MNIHSSADDMETPEVTTGPLPASSKVYTAPGGHDHLKVPMREIALSDGVPPLRVYDTSGVYTDQTVTIDVEQGLPRLRDRWVEARGNVERYDGREIKPEDNGGVSGKHLARAFEDQCSPYRRKSLDQPLTQFECARAGIVTDEMIYIAHRENLGRRAGMGKRCGEGRRR